MDFGGQRAGEILFERTGMSRYLEPIVPPWKGIARDPADGVAGHDRATKSARVDLYRMRGFGDYVQDDTTSNLQARDYKGAADLIVVKNPNWIVRRLTPTEYERLQGFPDGWTYLEEWIDQNGKKRKLTDTYRYKALGNSIALPQWWWIIYKMSVYLPRKATLGSLFDGIGGFPLVWETRHGKGTALWASEIEPFPIAVTKKRFK